MGHGGSTFQPEPRNTATTAAAVLFPGLPCGLAADCQQGIAVAKEPFAQQRHHVGGQGIAAFEVVAAGLPQQQGRARP